MLPELPRPYWYLGIFRIVLTCVPQTGYIHPDEYFQGMEIFVGKVFEVESSPPWEFNTSFPIRSMALPYFTVGMPYRVLNLANYFIQQLTGVNIIIPYTLLVAPRLVICLLSFLVDFSIYKICVNNNEKYQGKLIVLATSYVMLVYGSRTFSNTIELILFALLLYYVSESLTFSNILLKKKEYLNYRYETSRTTVERVKFHKLRLYLSSDSIRNCLEISSITVLGFFNRPTFLAYALFPIFFWLYRGLGNRLVVAMTFHLRILVLIVCAIPTLLLAIGMDSLFYGYLTWGEIGILDVGVNNFVFTPLNFLKYNTDSANLAKHGLHPRFLHLLVNLPLLFNVIALYGLYKCLVHVYNYIISGDTFNGCSFTRGKRHLLPTVRSIKGLMTLSFIVPVLLLSIFPHQEPRFLIPVIVPLIYLHAEIVLPEANTNLVKSKEKSVVQHVIPINVSRIFVKIWLILNAFFVMFYGIIHQGGVYQVTSYLSKDMKLNSLSTEYHIITSHIYSIPESFFMQRATDKLYFAKGRKYTVDKRVFLYEEGSKDLNATINKIVEIHAKTERQKKFKPNKKFRLFLIIPSSFDDKLGYYEYTSKLSFSSMGSVFPHVSIETFPELLEYFIYIFQTFSIDELATVILDSWYKIIAVFGLHLYEITTD